LFSSSPGAGSVVSHIPALCSRMWLKTCTTVLVHSMQAQIVHEELY